MMLLALALFAADPDRDVRGAWTMGYASIVERQCRGWRRLSARELVRRGLLGSPTTADWGVEGPFADRYWAGVEQAERDRRRAGWCRPAHWPASVRQVLRRGNDSPRR